MAVRIGTEEIDLRLTLMESAQCFLWREEAGVFTAHVAGRRIRLRRDGSVLWAEGADRAFLRDYLDLERDYAALRREAEPFPPVAAAMDALPGLRVLRQPTWEALVQFILSANNNVSRIRTLTARLCGDAGIPSPERLAGMSEESLRALSMGYRAPYLIGTARAVADRGGLEQLAGLSYEEAHAALKRYPGVGDKVADCVLVFGSGHPEAFPIDVWMERAMRSWFGLRARSRAALAEASRALLGPHAGLMQQYLFHAARKGLLPEWPIEG